jgi:hypothetical protein
MFASAQARVMALAISVAYAFATAPALAQSQPHEEHEETGLPRTPPPLESSNPNYEATPSAQPSGSTGLALMAALFGPLGFALGGLSAAAASGDVSSSSTFDPLAPGGQQRR